MLPALETALTQSEVLPGRLPQHPRAKLDAAGRYDSFEVDRVVAVELNPSSKQSELVKALEPAPRLRRAQRLPADQPLSDRRATIQPPDRKAVTLDPKVRRRSAIAIR